MIHVFIIVFQLFIKNLIIKYDTGKFTEFTSVVKGKGNFTRYTSQPMLTDMNHQLQCCPVKRAAFFVPVKKNFQGLGMNMHKGVYTPAIKYLLLFA